MRRRKKQTSVFSLSRPKTRRQSRVEAIQFLPHGSEADTTGAHSSRDSSSTSPRSERASVRLVWVKYVHNSLTMYIIILLLFFFVGSVVIFTFVTFLYFFPFSLPPPLEMSQWRFLQSLIVIVHC